MEWAHIFTEKRLQKTTTNTRGDTNEKFEIDTNAIDPDLWVSDSTRTNKE